MSGLKIEEKTRTLAVVSFTERLDAFNALAARKEIDVAIAKGAMNFVVDLKDVPFMDSAGVAVLVNLLKRSRQLGGNVKLIPPTNATAMRILKLTKFDRVFEMLENVDDAVASF